MEDERIIELFNARDEAAIHEAQVKYGAYCSGIAINLLGVREDAEECVSDAWHAAWNSIPPERPRSLRAFLGRITRNISISRWRREHAQKRFDGMDVLLSELDECVPGPFDVERELESRALTELIERWLSTLDARERALFVRRYWYGEGVAELARECGCSPAQLTQRLYRLRQRLRKQIESVGAQNEW